MNQIEKRIRTQLPSPKRKLKFMTLRIKREGETVSWMHIIKENEKLREIAEVATLPAYRKGQERKFRIGCILLPVKRANTRSGNRLVQKAWLP